MSAEVSAAPSSAPAAAPAAGGEPASTPAAAEPSSAPAAKPEPVDRAARALAAAARKGKPPEPAKPLGEAAPTGEAAKPTGEQQAAATPPVSDTRAMQDALRAEREAWEAKQRTKEMEAELARLREAEAKRKGMNPLQMLEADGLPFEQLTERIVKGEFKPKSAEQLAIESTKSELQQLREWKESQEREKQQAVKAQQSQAMAAQLSRELKEQYSAQYPTLAADPDAGAQLVALKEQHPEASWDVVAAHLEQQRSASVKTAAKSKAVLQALVADPEIKAQLLELLGSKSEQPAQQVTQGANVGNGPDAIPSTRAAEGSRVAPPRVAGTAGRQAAVLAAAERARVARSG